MSQRNNNGRNIRIEVAAAMLKNPNLTNAEIAEQLGVKSVHEYTAGFRRYLGKRTRGGPCLEKNEVVKKLLCIARDADMPLEDLLKYQRAIVAVAELAAENRVNLEEAISEIDRLRELIELIS